MVDLFAVLVLALMKLFVLFLIVFSLGIVESEKGFEYIKPILKPLFSDNFDYTIFLMDNFPEEKWADAYNDIMNGVGFGVKIEQIPYELHEFLFENHIDVFGLIEKGLAIDINTLSVE